MSDVLSFFYSILDSFARFLLSETFGLPFPIGFLFIVVFIFGLIIRYILLLAN